ncbi:cell wall-binding repeat-containing protein [Peptostreptococcus equinus]|uniref:Cell wall-binding repeat-containing protein n=1 Tax=Peptostreptococcus equinus TaxID=3003601 RepID=A0ABY7JNK8_9FIRM|nr:cell wall-binding repeat-containing protein [Peptostreptococcus sp. CBA3647]WAW14951.1 cell wall-binding repeat-containing protein [Peptostreptococcus sp. CBA3647]
MHIFKKIMAVCAISIFTISYTKIATYASSVSNNIILSGADRFETAIKISKYAYNSGASGVILVNSHSIPDSLAVGPLSKKLQYPVLLNSRDTINPTTLSEIKRLKANKIIIIGGENSISTIQENSLLKMGYTVERISGKDRSSTSIEIAKKLKTLNNNTSFNSVFFVEGYKSLVDAACASAAASKINSPIIFIGTNLDEFKNSLYTLNADNKYFIGGSSNNYSYLFNNSRSIFGKDRNETSLNIAKTFFRDYQYVFIAKNGQENQSELIDSVAVGGVAGTKNSPVIFVSKNSPISYSLKSYLDSKNFSTLVQTGGGLSVRADEIIGKIYIRQDYKLLNVNQINQYEAGAPMGCEAASLLQGLKYKGYASDKTLYSFLREMPIATDNNPYHGFAGTPYKVVYGVYQSIFPQPLSEWGNKYGKVENISGRDSNFIRDEISKGNPVVFYGTYDFKPPIYNDYFWGNNAVDNAHVMLVDGYNSKSMHIVDPAKNDTDGYWIANSAFDSSYNINKYAVVIR